VTKRQPKGTPVGGQFAQDRKPSGGDITTQTVEQPDGTKLWYRNGGLHREDGPAVELADGTREWYRNGERIPNPTKGTS
jgi:hypothetical protein